MCLGRAANPSSEFLGVVEKRSLARKARFGARCFRLGGGRRRVALPGQRRIVRQSQSPPTACLLAGILKVSGQAASGCRCNLHVGYLCGYHVGLGCRFSMCFALCTVN